MNKEEMFEKNKGLVHNFLKCYPARHKEDLIQEGYIGLLEAIDNYDSDKGAFSTLAYIYIKKRVFMFIKNNANIIRIPVYIKERWLFEHTEIFELTDEKDYEEIAIKNIQLQQFFNRKNIKKRTKIMIKMKLEGYTYDEIGKKFGISRQGAERDVKGALK